MDDNDYQLIRQLFDDYLLMYSSRDDRLTTYFSEDFSGFTGGGNFLVKDREAWVAITRQDFAQIKDPIRIELKDLAIQSLSDTIAVTTGFFTIHLPIKDHVLSRETARLVLIFRKESSGWKISHSSISIPYHLVGEGEVYPLKELVERNQILEELIAQRTVQLSEANDNLQQANDELAREIAERKQTEEALQQSNQKLEAIISASPDGIGMISLDGKLQLMSDKLAQMHGYPIDQKDEIIGRSGFDLIDPSSHKMLADNIRKLIADESDHKLTEYLAVKKDSSRFHVDMNSAVLRDSNGNPASILFVERDITERKRAEADKENLQAKNRQLQKAESLGRMAGAIAHHFNNQLGVVIGNLELALMELSQGVSPRAKMTEAMNAASKAAEMSGLMLTYLGQSFGKHEPLDISETCRRTLPMLQAIVSSDVALEVDLPAPGPVIKANANHILQILTNLITNAREANPEGRGAIHLSVRTVLAANISTLHRFPLDWQPHSDAYACLEVTDTGCGIEDKDIEELFDPFFSSKFAGRGMGLAVVLGIVRAHGGVVTVQSEPGRGSTFLVFFPVSEEAALHQASNDGAPGDALVSELAPTEMKESGTVLLVEDENMVRKIAAAMLERLGFSVLEAKDGIEAVEKFVQHQDEIRFVLCDLTMPRMNGWETLTALRELAADIPVILASGYDKAQAMAGDHPELPQVFLGKPYQLSQLRDAISQALVK
jgi:two-component system, cell cycle sensor histidine kinase and response regulator CckA